MTCIRPTACLRPQPNDETRPVGPTSARSRAATTPVPNLPSESIADASTPTLALETPRCPGATAPQARGPLTFEAFARLWRAAEKSYAASREVETEVEALRARLNLHEGARFHLTDAIITGDYGVGELYRWYLRQEAPTSPVRTHREFSAVWEYAEARYGASRDHEGTVDWLVARLKLDSSHRAHLEDAIVTGDYGVDELWRWYVQAAWS